VSRIKAGAPCGGFPPLPRQLKGLLLSLRSFIQRLLIGPNSIYQWQLEFINHQERPTSLCKEILLVAKRENWRDAL